MKLIKSAHLYKCELPTATALEAHLSENPFIELGSQEFSRAGFVNTPFDTKLITGLGDKGTDYAFTVRYDEKIIPVSVVKAETNKRVFDLETEQSRRLPKKERQPIKEQVVTEFLEKALVKTVETTCFYHGKDKLLIVPTGSEKIANIITGRLIKAVGSIKATTINIDGMQQGITAKLENFLNDSYTFADFKVEGSCKLKGEQGRAMSFKANDITESKDGILEAIAAGAKVTEIALSNDDVYFRINNDFVIKGITFLADTTGEQDFDDVLALFQHEAAAQVLLFANTIQSLLKLFEYQEPDHD